MKLLVGICVLATACSSVVPGQETSVPTKWLGTWTLNLQESKLGPIWGPGIRESGLTVTGQTAKIEVIAGRIRITGDTVISQLGTSHEAYDVDVDRGESVIPGGPKTTFKRIDDATFDIVVSVNNKALGNHVGQNRFVFSSDGRTLTETKTHTEREVAPEGSDPTKSAVIRSSTSVLVFHR
jgi:hypothetical protein